MMMEILNKNGNMGKCTHHGPCPVCGSRDNVAHYDDGGYHCFSGCGYHKNGSPILLRNKFIGTEVEEEEKKELKLPDDLDKEFPDETLKWFSKYPEITMEDVYTKFWYSKKRARHVWPHLYGGKPIFYEARSVVSLVSPKALSFGDKNLAIWDQIHEAEHCIIVEDIVSKIAVNNVFPKACVVALFGSSIPDEHILQIKNKCNTFASWLDQDKGAASFSIMKKGQDIGLKSRVVWSKRDPKEQDKKEIQENLMYIR